MTHCYEYTSPVWSMLALTSFFFSDTGKPPPALGEELDQHPLGWHY